MNAKLTATLFSTLFAGTAAAQTAPAYEEHFDDSTLDWELGSCRLGADDTCSAPALDGSTYASAPQSLAFSITRSCTSTETFTLGQATVDISLPPGLYQLDAAIRLRNHNDAADPAAFAQGSFGLFAASNVVNTASCNVFGGGRTCDRGFQEVSGCFGTGTSGLTRLLAQVSGTGCATVTAWLDDIVITPLPPMEVIFPADITVACGDSTDPSATGGVSVTGGCHPTVQHFDVVLGTCPGTIQRTWLVSGGAPAIHTQIITVGSSDGDNDGVLEPADLCLGTEAGAAVDADGCSCAQRLELACPSAGPWNNKGAYVSCVSHAATACVESGLISGEMRGEIVSAAAHR